MQDAEHKEGSSCSAFCISSSIFLLGCISSRHFLHGMCWEGRQGKEGQTEITSREEECALLPSVSPVFPQPQLRSCCWLTRSLTRSVSLRAGTAGGPAGDTFQLHPQQQPRGDSGVEAVCGAWDVICSLCTAGPRGSARDYVRCGGAGNRRDDGATRPGRIPWRQLGPCQLWSFLPVLDQ